ncbi:flagellar biosynthetic protein FliO [Aliikangiella sp. G2MR2-5]|uniref:flagellar biosynthetic protein FliO n=1 Tax=Aliikangiella sp. G2MR2-5 TaxID=2788943 RepID=UPI001AEDD409|nr:flagellar biosynthetic protein FliO [Aliikangiella sp. G2MR2-5]
MLISSGYVSSAEKLEKVTPVDSLLPMLLGLLCVITIIFFLAFLLKKLTNFTPQNNLLKVLECQRIGPKEKLLIVKVQDKQLLLGVTPNNISMLTQLEHPIEDKKTVLNFEKIMQQLVKPSALNFKKKQAGETE